MMLSHSIALDRMAKVASGGANPWERDDALLWVDFDAPVLSGALIQRVYDRVTGDAFDANYPADTPVLNASDASYNGKNTATINGISGAALVGPLRAYSGPLTLYACGESDGWHAKAICGDTPSDGYCLGNFWGGWTVQHDGVNIGGGSLHSKSVMCGTYEGTAGGAIRGYRNDMTVQTGSTGVDFVDSIERWRVLHGSRNGGHVWGYGGASNKLAMVAAFSTEHDATTRQLIADYLTSVYGA